MMESRDVLIDIYLSDQWRIHGGPRKRSAREELRDRLIPVVIRAFGSVESSLDLLLKESPCSNGHGISALAHAYELYLLRMRREAVEAGDQAAEQRFADLQGQFHKLEEYEEGLFGIAQLQDTERIHATLRTSVCNLPNFRPVAPPAVNPFQHDGSERPLGDNPFPSDHAAHDVFEEATWHAKEAINGLKSELLQTLSKPPFDLIRSILTYRLSVFSVCANAALSIVGNEKTAEVYERWIDAYAAFVLDETLQKGQLRDPSTNPETESQPLFTAELLPQISVDLHLQLMRAVAHYKEEAAKRVLLVRQERLKAFAGTSDDQQTEGGGDDGDCRTLEKASPQMSKASTRRGRRANTARRDSIRRAINKHGDQWRDHLPEIFADLDSEEAALGDFQSVKIDLGDGQSSHVLSWADLDLAQGKQRRQILDSLRKYFD